MGNANYKVTTIRDMLCDFENDFTIIGYVDYISNSIFKEFKTAYEQTRYEAGRLFAAYLKSLNCKEHIWFNKKLTNSGEEYLVDAILQRVFA